MLDPIVNKLLKYLLQKDPEFHALLVTYDEIIMENVPPPNSNPNAPEEEPFMDQAPAAFVEFAPQWIGEQITNNNNEEEEENEAMEDDDEDDAEVINPYEEADPHNRPPPTSDEETEGVKMLSKQMHDRYKMEKRMEKILRQEELRKNGQAFDITALDSAVRANTSESSNMMRLITDLSREFFELKCQNRKAKELSRWKAWYVMVRDAARGTREDEDVDTAAPWGTQPPKSHGSPHDSQ
nr:hypothetical protein [Tanacetum cinerariifolium]